MPARFDLTPSAKADIRSIWLYTVETWGEEQADRYIEALDARFVEIAAGKAFSRTFSDTYPQVRVTRCEHHYIFHLSQQRKRPRIIAILHERMDLLTRLQERLPV
jgi:plasmid stabilization system protein ParE